MVTLSQLSAIMPAAARAGRLEQWVSPINLAMAEFGIDTPLRQAYFLAITARETGELATLVENMNYSAERLAQVWPSHFAGPNALAHELAHKPEALANYIYADANRPPGYRMGNTQPGDGWRYRGVGIPQLTGRNNVEAVLKRLGRDPGDTAYLQTPHGAARGGGDYWKHNDLSRLADADAVIPFHHRVNGGMIGYDAFVKYLKLAKSALDPANEPVSPPETMKSCKRGDKGALVKTLQKELWLRGLYTGLIDGDYGPQTEGSVMAFQRRAKLTDDGWAGPLTFAALGL